MLSWRDHILKEFPPAGPRLTLFEDSDCLLAEEEIARTLRERGYDLLTYEDPVAFRLVYESEYRRAVAADGDPPRNLIVRTEEELRVLPYDLLRSGRSLGFGLGELFPTLSYPVIAELRASDFEALYQAQRRHRPRTLGQNATRDFVLRHVFELAPETIAGPPELLHALLRRHYREQRVPAALDEYLIGRLRQNVLLADWPLERIVPDRETFLAFLQERWAVYLEYLTAEPAGEVREARYALSCPGPAALPFDHQDVRVYLDNLFLEGDLRPLAHPAGARLAARGHWAVVGVRLDPETDRRRRIQGLIGATGQTLPPADARHAEWLLFARGWAELLALYYVEGGMQPEIEERFRALRERVESSFLAWVLRYYGGLHNQPPVPPAMVHHLPRVLARAIAEEPGGRVAVVVLDGLALTQWVVLSEVLRGQDETLQLREQALFAWAPTLTSVSRQALLSGRPPLYFPASIHTTEREPALWERFWIDEGLAPAEIAYRRGVDENDLAEVGAMLSRSRIRTVALVVDKVDRIMHGMQLGAAGMQGQVRQWAEGGFLAKLLGLLLGRGFKVYLTSDHGNVEAVGIGRPGEGMAAEVRGVRARVYGDALLREQVRARFPRSLAWPGLGLPDDYLPLLAAGHAAFAAEGERVVAHGGISIEELIVPLVQVERPSGAAGGGGASGGEQ